MSILKELRDRLPADANISEVKFEGSELVLYTKSKDFFRTSESSIRDIVRLIKKRVEIRPDISITIDPEKARDKIMEIVPEGAGIKEIYFESELGKVIIEAQKPGLIIGRDGETFKKIKSETLWLPKIERAPAIKSDVVRAVRGLMHSEIAYRKKFLNRVGQDINARVLTEEERNNEWIRITSLGGFRQVGRSCILVQTSNSNVLMDCGTDPTTGNPPYLNIPEFNMDTLDAIILSHAHTDHSSYIPYLYENGFTGPLYSTAPTRDLMAMLCLDYIDVMQKNGKKPPYQKKSVEKALKHSIVLDYGEVSDITVDARLTLQPSGHLLGGSLIHLHIGDGLHNLLYTGDLNYANSGLLDPAYTDFQRIETMIIESTYGGAHNTMPSRQDAEKSFVEKIEKGIKLGGKVIIPSFGVGRAQEIMVILDKFGLKYPVHMEGMLWDATAIHTAYPEYLSHYLQKSILRYGKNPFTSEVFNRVAPKERNDVIDSGEPGIIIATSGMMTGGPILEYVKGLADDPKNTLLFVGYQAEGTLGRRIQEGWKDLPVFNHKTGRNMSVGLKLNIDTAHGISGHAGRNQILNFFRRLRSKPDKVLVNHGENKRCLELARDLHKIFRIETVAPKNLETTRLR
ncbi:MAG: beta-CASP ribonuclease aCPSF1 [Candidatus Aenigmatarchaeota archaeon]